MKINEMPLPDEVETKIYTPRHSEVDSCTMHISSEADCNSENDAVKIYHHSRNNFQCEM